MSKKKRANDGITAKEFNKWLDFAKRNEDRIIDSYRRTKPIEVVAARDFDEYSILSLAITQQQTEPLTTVSGDNHLYLTNGPFSVGEGSTFWAWFMQDAMKVAMYSGAEPTVGNTCGVLENKMHKDFIGFFCLSVNSDDNTCWVMKSNDMSMVAQVGVGGITKFEESNLLLGTGEVDALMRDGILKEERELTVFSADGEKYYSGDFIKVVQVDRVGWMPVKVCSPYGFVDIGSETSSEPPFGDCLSDFELVTDIQNIGPWNRAMEVTKNEFYFRRHNEAFCETDEEVNKINHCCYVCECDDLPDILPFKGCFHNSQPDPPWFGNCPPSGAGYGVVGGEWNPNYVADGEMYRTTGNNFEHRWTTLNPNTGYLPTTTLSDVSCSDGVYLGLIPWIQDHDCGCRPVQAYQANKEMASGQSNFDTLYSNQLVLSEDGTFNTHFPSNGYFDTIFGFGGIDPMPELCDEYCLKVGPWRKFSLTIDGVLREYVGSWRGTFQLVQGFPVYGGRWAATAYSGLDGIPFPSLQGFGNANLKLMAGWGAMMTPLINGKSRIAMFLNVTLYSRNVHNPNTCSDPSGLGRTLFFRAGSWQYGSGWNNISFDKPYCQPTWSGSWQLQRSIWQFADNWFQNDPALVNPLFTGMPNTIEAELFVDEGP